MDLLIEKQTNNIVRLFLKSNNYITLALMKASELLKLLKRDGWFETRQTGSHVIMIHPDKKGQLVVPNHGSREVPTGTLNAILKEANLKTKKR